MSDPAIFEKLKAAFNAYAIKYGVNYSDRFSVTIQPKAFEAAVDVGGTATNEADLNKFFSSINSLDWKPIYQVTPPYGDKTTIRYTLKATIPLY